MTGFLLNAFIYLLAAVIMVPLAKRLGLGSVLGYLIAGVIIGPLTGLVGQETQTIQHFAEYGVVMMLFLVGLELDPKSLWNMRARLLGLGGLQVVLTTAAVTGLAMAAGLVWSVALAVGLIFSLSSTAIVLQTFNEKGLGKREGGRSAFSVLLFQDIAVIPMLALIPLLALPELLDSAAHAATDGHEDITLVSHLPGWANALVVMGSVVGLVLAGRYLSRPLFRFVAGSGLREAFTATALMLVIGIAALMSMIGLSPALGTFLAGVVLANSEFRHELESDIEPFKGLLLGLFFITVGAGIRFDVLEQNLAIIVGMTLGLMLLKLLILLVLGLIFRMRSSDFWLFGLSLAQAGEFGFVLLNYSVGQSVLPAELAQKLSMVVALSMFLTPALFIVFEKLIQPRYRQNSDDRAADTIDEKGSVIIAGSGRFGQIVNRILVANGYTTIVLDHKPETIDIMRRVNIKSYYGDASRPDLLHSAGIDEARLLVIAIDDPQRALTMLQHVKQAHPHVQVLARAFDRRDFYELKDAGADFVISETYHSALETGVESLRRLGVHAYRAEQIRRHFMRTESEHSDTLFNSWRNGGEGRGFDDQYRKLFIEMQERLLEVMQTDRMDSHSPSERGWTPPPPGYETGEEHKPS